MGIKIALAGKGGTGKTTISALIIRSIIEQKKGAVLALDADPNSNLNEILGVKVTDTVGMIREDFKKQAPRLAGGIYKDQLVEMNVHQALVEGKGFDLLVMGRGEGPGCYCYANNLFKKYIDILQDNYNYVVMDNEAGMEHLSRRTTSDVDFLLIISDPSPKGILTASRIKELSEEMNIKARKTFLIINRVRGKLDERLKNYIGEKKFDLLDVIDEDENIYEMDLNNKTVFDIPSNSPAFKKVSSFIKELGI
ncbi:MAG: AAA family ATPase [Actinomycetota bacterium]|nr:AAA family ATPase [Actinomycetota bacterium]